MTNADDSYAHDPEIYDAIYYFKDYAAEAARIRQLLTAEGVLEGSRLLDAGCGTGAHLVHLRDAYDVSGFDLSPQMIEGAKRKLPTAKLFVADLANFTLPSPVGAITCLFGAIGYVQCEDDLRSAAASFARALVPGGAILVEPWLTKSEFHAGRMTLQTFDGEHLKIARAVVSKREGEVSVLDFHWLVMRSGRPDVESFTTRHRLWMCPTATLLRTFADAGFECRFEKQGLMEERGLIIGRLPR
jgi:SAM-dependent methyltransferase